MLLRGIFRLVAGGSVELVPSLVAGGSLRLSSLRPWLQVARSVYPRYVYPSVGSNSLQRKKGLF